MEEGRRKEKKKEKREKRREERRKGSNTWPNGINAEEKDNQR